MTLPSLDDGWRNGQRIKPRILVLEVRPREQPEAEPIAWLLVEREETFRCDPQDGRVYEATIRLSYRRITAKGERMPGKSGFFEGSYSGVSQSVSITGSAVFLDPAELRGNRVGTYLMSEIVLWAKRWPDAKVRRVELVIGQADEGNKVRRNRFYERFGLVFDYSDAEQKEGRSRPMPARLLTSVDTWRQNITERPVMDYLSDLLRSQTRTALALQQRTQAVESLVAEQRRLYAHPVRWVLRTLYHQYVGIVASGAVIVGLVALAWIKYA